MYEISTQTAIQETSLSEISTQTAPQPTTSSEMSTHTAHKETTLCEISTQTAHQETPSSEISTQTTSQETADSAKRLLVPSPFFEIESEPKSSTPDPDLEDSILPNLNLSDYFPESDDPFVDKQYRMMKNVEENSRELKRMDDIIDVLQNILEKLLYRITETGPLDCNLIKNSLRRQQKRVKHHPSL